MLNKVPGTAIAYVRNRRKTKEIADYLNKKNISADYYHAGLDHATRSKKQEAWTKNKTRVMVSTNAFGMGIDKPDVRLVVHMDVPDDMESYFQEAGREEGMERNHLQCCFTTTAMLLILLKGLNILFPLLKNPSDLPGFGQSFSTGHWCWRKSKL